jgi:uncharacterized protein
MTSRDIRITMPDGVQLAATLYLPVDAGPGRPTPCLLEALPYRKDDVTFGYASEYERLRNEFGYAVCRLDLRGTGSSAGIATDEYPVQEQDDLVEVIAWLAAQPWCTGSVGMYGTSYSGFNSIQVAMRRPPALKAIVPIYATDDRYTDDVHYMGGVRRLLDLVDYPTYMIAMNALPPVPEIFGDGWREEWRRRVDQTEPWLLRWEAEPHDGPYWRHGSLRTDYAAIAAPTMIIAGWADGYRNNSLRTYNALTAAGTPTRLLIGPWSHQDGANARPGPHADVCAEMARWFDRWLRGDESAATDTGIVYFARHSSPPEPDASVLNGAWQTESRWPSPRFTDSARPLGGGVVSHQPIGGTGTAAWNSCAGSLPWGQPTDQRYDDAASLTWQWPGDGMELLGHASLRLAVSVDRPTAAVSAKLTDIAPDGTSTLITRALQAVRDADTTATSAVQLEFEATSWTFAPGHQLRLSVTGMDWPNTLAAPAPFRMTVDGDASALTLPIATASPTPAPGYFATLPEPERDADHAEGVVWRISDDVLTRTTSCHSGYGSTYDARFGSCTDAYRGEVTIDRRTWRQTATSSASFELTGPSVHATAAVDVRYTFDESETALDITLRVLDGETVFAKHTWRQVRPR